MDHWVVFELFVMATTRRARGQTMKAFIDKWWWYVFNFSGPLISMQAKQWFLGIKFFVEARIVLWGYSCAVFQFTTRTRDSREHENKGQ